MKELTEAKLDAIRRANYNLYQRERCYNRLSTTPDSWYLVLDGEPLKPAYQIGAAFSACPGVVSTDVLDEIRRLSTEYVELYKEIRRTYRIPGPRPSVTIGHALITLDAIYVLEWAVKTAYSNANAKIFGDIHWEAIGPIYETRVPTPERWDAIKCFIENPEVILFVESQLKTNVDAYGG